MYSVSHVFAQLLFAAAVIIFLAAACTELKLMAKTPAKGMDLPPVIKTVTVYPAEQCKSHEEFKLHIRRELVMTEKLNVVNEAFEKIDRAIALLTYVKISNSLPLIK